MTRWMPRALVALLFSMSACDDGSGTALSEERVTLATYFERLQSVKNAIRALPELGIYEGVDTAYDWFQAESDLSQEAYDVISPLIPPDVVANEHFELLDIMKGRIAVNTWIQSELPDGLAPAEGEAYQYRTPLVGQYRIRLERVDCSLDKIAAANNLGVESFGTNCNVSGPPPVSSEVLGSEAQPVSVINIKSRGLVMDQNGQEVSAPDLDFGYASVYAKAGRITLNYDNQNPEPFKHNAVVYRNATATNLKTSEIVAGTPGGSGPATHTIDFELQPGEYTIVCNVHLDLQKTKLVVVP